MDTTITGAVVLPDINISDLDRLLFKYDHLYQHNILCINYTTHNVCRKQDSVNSATPHYNIMVLANANNKSDHPYTFQ